MDTSENRKRGLVLIACMGVMFMTAVEGTIVATAMPTVAGALGGYALFGWTFAAYLLAQATTIPIYGRMSDLYGRKPMFFIGVMVFILGSAICGAAPTMLVLIIGRAVQGFGAGGVLPTAQTIVGDVFTPAERAKIQGYLSSMWAISAIIGPAMGAFMVQRLSWPMIFWFNIPLALIVLTLIATLFHEKHKPAQHSLDVIGAVLLVLAVGGFMLALMQGDHLGALLVPILIVATVSFVILMIHERRTPEPLLPLAIWKNGVIRTCNIGSLVIGAASMGVTVYLPTYVQGVFSGSAYSAGTVLSVMSISWPVSATISGRLMLRTSYRTTALIGGGLLLAGMIMLTALAPSSGRIMAMAAALLVGGGLGLLNSPFVVATQDVAAWNVRGIAIAFNTFNRMLGAALGTAIFGAAMNWSMAASLPGITEPVQQLIDPIKRKALAVVDVEHFRVALAHALRMSFSTGIVIALAACAAAWTLPRGMRPEKTHHRGAKPADAE